MPLGRDAMLYVPVGAIRVILILSIRDGSGALAATPVRRMLGKCRDPPGVRALLRTGKSALQIRLRIAVPLVRQPTFESPARGGYVMRVQDGRNYANAPGTGGDDLVHIAQIDATNREPGNAHIRRGPPHIIERHGLRGRFGTRGI